MTTYYRYNALTRILTAEPRYIVTIDGRTIANPTAEQYATLRDAYPRGEDAPQPELQEGKVAAYNGYLLGESDHLWHKQWMLVDAPPTPPRIFSKLKVVAALTEAGVWAQVKAWIEANGLYDLYLAAQEFAEDNEWFAQGKGALQTALGWTDEQVEALLAKCAEEGA